MTKTLVTGGTGFLGRHLVRLLVEGGADVRVMARRPAELDGVEFVAGDVTNPDDLRRAVDGCERVFHVAAEVRDGQPKEVYESTNVRAVESLLEMAPGLGVKRLVHTSSYFAIGRTGEPRQPADQIADEYWTHDPSDMHDEHEQSKYDAEHEVNQRVSLSEPVVALIPTMMYGPELREVSGLDGLSPGNRIVRMLADHERGDYPGFPGDGRQIWNLVHVEDVARGHVLAMDAADPWPPPGWKHWHYVLGGENLTVAQLFEAWAAITGRPAPKALGSGKRLFGGPKYGGRSKERFAMDSHSWAYSSDFAAEDFGYRGRPLAEGLEATAGWMRERGWIG